MRLLILGMNYAPEVTGIAPFTTGLAEHMAKRGHQVVVATTFPHYPYWRVQAPFAGRWHSSERRGGVVVLRSRVFLPGRGSTIRRILYDTSLAAGTLVNTLPLTRADIVLCISPPIQLALTGGILARLWGAPLVLQIQDLPLDAALAVGMLRRGLAYRFGRLMECLAYRFARQIVVVSDGFYHSLVRQGVPAVKLSTIPNWADTDAVRPLSPEPSMRALLGAEGDDFLVLHTGNMGEKQGLSSAIEAAKRSNDLTPSKLTLVGDGSDRRRLQKFVTQLGLENVRLIPLQPTEVFPRLLAAADALLLNQRADVIESVAPSKLLTYMAAGRPVLAAVHPDSEAALVVRAANCGLLVTPERPRALAEAIGYLARDPDLRATLGANGRLYVEKHYARDRVMASYEAFFSQLLDPIPEGEFVGSG